jgi:hypothetical protein
MSVHITGTPANASFSFTGSVNAEPSPAKNYKGTALGVVKDTVQTLVTVSVSDYQLRGFVGHGTSDGYYTLILDGTKIYEDSTNAAKRNASIILPNPEHVSGTLSLKVLNSGKGTGDFWGVVMGEE